MYSGITVNLFHDRSDSFILANDRRPTGKNSPERL